MSKSLSGWLILTDMIQRCSYVVLLLLCPASIVRSAEPERVEFTREVQPILQRACWKCHGPEKQKGGMRFDLKADVLRAGDSGKKAVLSGRPNDSELIRRVEAPTAEERMPPNSDPLNRDEIKILRAWIEQGANFPEAASTPSAERREMVVTEEDRQHWSYRPLRKVDPLKINDADTTGTSIDRFIRAALEAKGIRHNPPADRRTLIRRVYFDMLGLPPSPEDVEAFVADPSPQAYDDLIDRLLSSPHYGERWGRRWLDVARYADSDGLETDRDRRNA